MTRANFGRQTKNPMVTLLTIKLFLPACTSLKEKRGRIQPIITQIRKTYKVSMSEVGLQDVWQSAWLACVLVSNNNAHNTQILNDVVKFLESHFPNEQIEEHHIETR